MHSPRTTRFTRLLIPLLVGCLVVLFTAAAPRSQASASSIATSHPLRPAISTSCPASGTARAAYMPSMTLGTHSTIVYIVNEGTFANPTFGTLKRYDVVTGVKVEVVKMANTYIASAQVSANGQWLLFVAQSAGQVRLQLIRMDGQYLQTLYCGAGSPQGSILDEQWSTNQHLVVFLQVLQSGTAIYLLNVTNGALQVELPAVQTLTFAPRTWLDNTRVYVTLERTDSPPTILYILDTSKGANQNPQNLQKVFDGSSTPFCWDFDSSYDTTKLFTTQCTVDPNPNGPGAGNYHGPSVINVRPATGGSPTSVYTRNDLAFTSVRAVTSSTLLFTVGNTSGVTSQNGLWRVGTNGFNPVRLTGTGNQLNQFSQFPWSNVSRNGSQYVLGIVSGSPTSPTYTLEYGSMSGGAPFVFASITNVQLLVVGWTTM
ncbi:MAG: hypothetical protein E6J11_02480 [Chloroflexi bacterium]|nr:MAG: hypothetical protein E6J11_02480 [Chloroflexota bacterium]TMD69468.1 MAG: hypothetical protein E6I97_21335 [Chloroflexota bacterium]